MRIALSNIAWEPAEDDAIATLMGAAGVSALEAAPGMFWPRPATATAEECRAVRGRWRQRGMDIVSLQALLFGQDHLRLFDSPQLLDETVAYLGHIFRIAKDLGAVPLVFGSPKNRQIGTLPLPSALERAVSVFRRIGDAAAASGVLLCIEPNAAAYQCDFVTNTDEAVELVRRVAHPAVRLHLDAGIMTMNGENPEAAIEAAADLLAHFHVSEPFLRPIGTAAVDHRRYGAALRRVGYGGYASIEMRRGPAPNRAAVERALQVARDAYGD